MSCTETARQAAGVVKHAHRYLHEPEHLSKLCCARMWQLQDAGQAHVKQCVTKLGNLETPQNPKDHNLR